MFAVKLDEGQYVIGSLVCCLRRRLRGRGTRVAAFQSLSLHGGPGRAFQISLNLHRHHAFYPLCWEA